MSVTRATPTYSDYNNNISMLKLATYSKLLLSYCMHT